MHVGMGTPVRIALVCVLALAVLACRSESTPTLEPTAMHTQAPPPTTVGTVVPTQPAVQLPIAVAAVPDELPPYDRDDWRHWTDEDKDCQNTRHEVLTEESRVPVE